MFVTISESNMCRLCGWEDKDNLQLYDEEVCLVFSNHILTAKVPELLEQSLNLDLNKDLELPKKICKDCKSSLQIAAEFLTKIREGQIYLQKLLEAGGVHLELKKDIRWDYDVKFEPPPPKKGKRGRPKKGFEKKRPVGSRQKEEETQSPEIGISAGGLDKRKRKPPKHLDEFEVSNLESTPLEEEPTKDSGWKRVSCDETSRLNMDEDTLTQYVPVLHDPNSANNVDASRPNDSSKVDTCASSGKFLHNEGDLKLHKREHGPFMFRCALIDCELLFRNKAEMDLHQATSGHQGVITLSFPRPTDIQIEQCQPVAQETKDEQPTLAVVGDNINNSVAHEPDQQIFIGQESTEDETEPDDPDPIDDEPADVASVSAATAVVVTKKPVSTFVSTFRPAETNPGEEGKPLLTSDKDSLLNLTCKNCLKAFDSGFSLQAHVCAGHQCSACALSFTTEANYMAHLRLAHEVASTRSHQCDQCDREFPAASSLQYHRESVHKKAEYFCTVEGCNKGFKMRGLLRRHLKTHTTDRPYKCDICNKGFKRSTNLKAHVLSHESVRHYFCDVCGQGFKHVTSLRLHMKLHLGEKKFVCTFCGKDFTQKGNMKEHMRIHTGEKPFQCTQCLKCFATSSQLRSHTKGHDTAKPHHCSQCPKSFKHTESLKVHMKRHLGEKPFTCDICQKSFMDLSSLKKHGETTHNPVKGRVPCDTCGKSYADKSSLRKHMKTHAPGDEEKHTVWNIIKDVGADQVDGDEEEGEIQQVIYIAYEDDETDLTGGEVVDAADLSMVHFTDKDGQQIRLVTPINMDPLTFTADYLKDLQSIPVTE